MRKKKKTYTSTTGEGDTVDTGNRLQTESKDGLTGLLLTTGLDGSLGVLSRHLK